MTIPKLDLKQEAAEFFGDRSKITQREMADFLAALSSKGFSLENDCIIDGSDTPEGWASAMRGINCISLSCGDSGESGRFHGFIRWDSPGQMSPRHHAELMFVGVSTGKECGDYLELLCDRLFLVEADPAAG